MIPEIPFTPETKTRLLFFAVCFGTVFVLYGASLFGDFVFDDRGIVEHRALLGNPALIGDVLASPYWTESAGLYRPVTLASYTLNFSLLGAGPAGFHIVNLLLYAATGFLLFLLVEKLSRKKLLAYLTAILFLVLPIHSEAVANISGRSEILALFFSLLCFLELLKSRERSRSYWPAGLWIFLAIGSKETAVAALPLAALIVSITERGAPHGERRLLVPALKEYAPAALWLATGSVAYFALRFAVLGQQHFLSVETTMVENPLKFADVGPRVFTALNVLWLYVEKSFWPITLCSDYSYNQLPVLRTFFTAGTILGAIVLSWLAVSLIIFIKRAPLVSLGSAFFLFSFLPVANLVFPTGTIMGERLMFYPSVGLCLYAAFLFYETLTRKDAKMLRYAGIGALSVLLAFYSARSFSRTLDWLTEKRLFTSAAACAPDSVLSTANLGAVYYLEGDLAASKQTLLLSQEIYDSYPKGVNNLGLVYWKEGDTARARELFLKALDSPFPYYGAYENLALISLQEGDLQEARAWLLKLYGGDVDAVGRYLRGYTGASPAR